MASYLLTVSHNIYEQILLVKCYLSHDLSEEKVQICKILKEVDTHLTIITLKSLRWGNCREFKASLSYIEILERPQSLCETQSQRPEKFLVRNL